MFLSGRLIPCSICSHPSVACESMIALDGLRRWLISNKVLSPMLVGTCHCRYRLVCYHLNQGLLYWIPACCVRWP